MYMKKYYLSTAALLAFPLVVSAQQLTGVKTLVGSIGEIVGSLIPIVFALALLYFFWGVGKYILAAGDEGAKEQGKNIMIGGIIALFVMTFVWGLVKFVGDALDIDQVSTQVAPGIGDPGVQRNSDVDALGLPPEIRLEDFL
jgi:hypothetical protein